MWAKKLFCSSHDSVVNDCSYYAFLPLDGGLELCNASIRIQLFMNIFIFVNKYVYSFWGTVQKVC